MYFLPARPVEIEFMDNQPDHRWKLKVPNGGQLAAILTTLNKAGALQRLTWDPIRWPSAAGFNKFLCV